MGAKTRSPRERAARALCKRDGHPENTIFEGRPMWANYLDEVDVVLIAALDEATWQAIRSEGPDD